MKKAKSIGTDGPAFLARAEHRRNTWTMTRFNTLDAMKAAQYVYWASQPAHVVMAAISELTTAAYAMKGIPVMRIARSRPEASVSVPAQAHKTPKRIE